MKVCSEVKVLKDDNKEIMKKGNALSVALKSCKKDLDLTLKTSGKEIEALKEELATLKEFKIQQQEEKRKVKKQEKKTRQKEKKKHSKSVEEGTVNEPEEVNNPLETKSDSEQKSEAIVEIKPVQTDTNDSSKNSENIQEQEIQPFNWTSDEIRFNYF